MIIKVKNLTKVCAHKLKDNQNFILVFYYETEYQTKQLSSSNYLNCLYFLRTKLDKN